MTKITEVFQNVRNILPSRKDPLPDPDIYMPYEVNYCEQSLRPEVVDLANQYWEEIQLDSSLRTPFYTILQRYEAYSPDISVENRLNELHKFCLDKSFLRTHNIPIEASLITYSSFFIFVHQQLIPNNSTK